ncbi:MAG: hypothetical protein EB830_02675 [Nitrosopumilus sp. H13]|nr:MAG: hypothetical protein EB830_02675 [Nitrosopumilus sp. H13]
MIPWRTVIGLIAGSVIVALGATGLVLHLGVSEVSEDNAVAIGDTVFYTIPAPTGAQQYMRITGDAFGISLDVPGDSPVQESDYRDEAELDWTHEQDGETRIKIQNTGSTDLEVAVMAMRSYDPIWFTYDLMVMISGVVIIGFSMGFVLRRPKGF